ncbi:MAG: M1 family aminopeptidase/hydrolase, partial [Acidobacteriota bacterium]
MSSSIITVPSGLCCRLLIVVLIATACGGSNNGDTRSTSGNPSSPAAPAATAPPMHDVHSYARPEQIIIEHLDLDLSVDFDAQTLAGRASLTVQQRTEAQHLHLDTRDLDIRAVYLDDATEPTHFELAEADPFLGQELTIDIEPTTQVVHIDYASRPEAAAVQWLDPAQTSGGEHPFLFTQSQAILARTWVPCQDSPAVRFTYEATIRVPPPLIAVMSAENPTEPSADGVYHFRMPQAIPSYLLALAVGDLAFRPLGERAGVFAEPGVVEKAAYEFAETEEMMTSVERLYGPYLWGRFDILVLPPSFPFGGMENPRLTFATPTILAGDRSLVALIAHELAHSWSGNLVTNATWNDFWLNEGFTVYLERRIMEELHGEAYATMLTALGQQDLEQQVARLADVQRDTHLFLDLAGRDPDDGMTDIAYEKGYFFLRMLEEAVGR